MTSWNTRGGLNCLLNTTSQLTEPEIDSQHDLNRGISYIASVRRESKQNIVYVISLTLIASCLKVSDRRYKRLAK